jgi:hypothetical protein
MWRKLIISVLGLIFAASFAACTVQADIGIACTDSSECLSDEYCDPVALVCTAAITCVSTNDCPTGLACGDDGFCDLYDCPNGQADCPSDSICDATGVCN